MLNCLVQNVILVTMYLVNSHVDVGYPLTFEKTFSKLLHYWLSMMYQDYSVKLSLHVVFFGPFFRPFKMGSVHSYGAVYT